MVKIAILNLYLHKLEKADIQFHNPLTTGIGNLYPGKTFDVILANPPFAGKIQDESILAELNLNTRATELLFVKWFVDHLSPKGRAGVIVPNGVLFGGTKAAVKIRQLLINDYGLQAVINLASGVFKPYSGVGTAILILDRGKAKRKKDDFIWFYDVTNDGFLLMINALEIPGSDIPDILAKWEKREEGINSYRVPIEKILASEDRSLAAGRYKKVVAQITNHDTPQDIIAEVLMMEQEILNRTKTLLKSIK